jgi:hypothetical protein
MSGRAMLFKTIARETSERRGGFLPVAAGMNLSQGVSLLAPAQANSAVASAAAIASNRQALRILEMNLK